MPVRIRLPPTKNKKECCNMKYFHIKEPYFALIRANSKPEAITQYVTEVTADNDNEVGRSIEEISRDHALILFSQCVGEEKISLADIMLSFEDDSPAVLGVDAMLS